MSAMMIGLGKISADSPPKAGNVNEGRVAAGADVGANWLLNGRTFDEGHFSPLQQITDQNIGGLGLAWYMDVDSAARLRPEIRKRNHRQPLNNVVDLLVIRSPKTPPRRHRINP
jgi:glucose dehydrogenase